MKTAKLSRYLTANYFPLAKTEYMRKYTVHQLNCYSYSAKNWDAAAF